ncbi:UNVERIFIED_CONTAM: hypothetical protein Slati_2683400 [Sesamum latifolium]|uniref:Uncharacterized protein n=1 Tax=Sesamum latifolium TaxID=2727402 RepID=A0AAW2VX71_9LAMI
MAAERARLDFPNSYEGQWYLEYYWKNCLLEYQKSEEFKGEVAMIVEPFLRYDFQACQEQFIAQEYPPAGPIQTLVVARNPFTGPPNPTTETPHPI